MMDEGIACNLFAGALLAFRISYAQHCRVNVTPNIRNHSERARVSGNVRRSPCLRLLVIAEVRKRQWFLCSRHCVFIFQQLFRWGSLAFPCEYCNWFDETACQCAAVVKQTYLIVPKALYFRNGSQAAVSGKRFRDWFVF